MKNPIKESLIVNFIVIIMLNGLYAQHDHHHHVHQEEDIERINALRFDSDHPAINIYGKWESVIPEKGGGAVGKSLGMQTVHNILLPSGKVLMTSGSSWRNLEPMEYYPKKTDPVAGKGLFDLRFDPFHLTKIKDYYELVNNTAIYDPEENTFFRIHSPYPMVNPSSKDHFLPNDLFCAGHLHLADGNPLFSGGTQYYYPYRTGHQSSFIFDWRKELMIDWQYIDWRQKPAERNNPWTFAGLMKRGRWYPTLVPLLDGRFVVSGGFVGFDKGYPDMYQFEINKYVEFFNYEDFNIANPQKAWKAIDVTNIEHSPFSTLLEYPQKIENICYDIRHLTQLGFDTEKADFVPPCNCPDTCLIDHKYDAFKLYPHNYLFGKNRIYLSREGEWVSLRTAKTEYMRRTKYTYWMEICGTPKSPEIKFERGPDRLDTITSYGTSYLDPNTQKLTIIGGQESSAGTLLPIGATKPNRFAGGRGSRKLEQFSFDKKTGEGAWTTIENFLGDYPQDDRTMHYAIILPTRQILIINGGNYDFYGAVKYPILLSPIFDKNGNFKEYKKERMAEAVEPRLYHNNAMLLPDGKVFVSGGNSGRATVQLDIPVPNYQNINGQPLPNNDLVQLDLHFLTDGPMAKQQKGVDNTPIENWTAEIFSPPYLFIDCDKKGNPDDRRVSIEKITTKAKKGIEFNTTIKRKTFTLLHSNREYKIKLGGTFPKEKFTGSQSLVLLKLPSVTHGGQWGQLFAELPIQFIDDEDNLTFITPNAVDEGLPPGFYMLFYVDSAGKPSKAKMIRFDDKAKRP